MHILFLTDNFPPETNAPASRTFEHALEWIKSGHQVTIITGAPNFPKGEVFPGYRNRLWQSEIMDGLRVIRVWTYISANEGVLKRTLDYMSFMISAFLASLCVRQVDIVVGTSPQFFTVCAAYACSCFKQVPWVFELRDLWPESIRAVDALGDSKMLDRLERLELFLYRKANWIISVTESFKCNLIERGINATKISVVTNGVDMGKFFPREKDVALVDYYDLKGKFVVGYIGTHGMAHALETVLDAAEIVRCLPGGDRFRFVLLGEGAKRDALKRRVADKGLENILFIESVSKQEIARYWSLLDVSLIHLKKTELFTTVIPSKLFESMAMGIPILHGVQGESAQIVERDDVGIVFESENAAALVQALIRLAEDQVLYKRLKTNGVVAAQKYDRRKLAGQMLINISSL